MNRLFVLLLICSGLAYTQESPVYCQADTIKAMRAIWAGSSNGLTGVEAVFILNGTPENYTVEIEKSSNEYMHQSIYLWPNTFAVFHTHPNNSGEFPSTPKDAYAGRGDTALAEQYNVDMYVVSSRGLSVYRPSTKEIVKLRNGFAWAKQKGCF